jgi:predicted nuclease of predicted toxin-antitoxin system
VSTGLFIELYLDEDLDILVAQLVRSQGFDVLTTDEAGNKGLSDPEQLEFAVRGRRAIVTHNRNDFEALIQQYAAAGRQHFGVIIAVKRTPQELTRRLLAILNNTTADEMIDQVRYI